MAYSLAKGYLKLNYKVMLAGRDLDKLEPIKKDLEVRMNGQVETLIFDAEDFDSHGQFVSGMRELPQLTVCIFGYLGDQEVAKNNWAQSARIINTNYTGAVSILNLISERYKQAKSGTIVGISSVAGDRGRESNYIYGSAKAGFSAYLSGLRSEMFKHGLHVVTVKPGFVRTKMTKDLKLPGPITATPDQVANAVIKAVRKKKNTIYVLPVWFLIMTVIKSIPEFIFKRLKL